MDRRLGNGLQRVRHTGYLAPLARRCLLVVAIVAMSLPTTAVAQSDAPNRGSLRDLYGWHVVDDVLYFQATDGTHGTELWRTDGTPQGTRLTRDINPGSASARPRVIGTSGDVVLLAADDGEHGAELWRTDGTKQGTRLVRDIRAGAGSSEPTSAQQAGSVLVFAADDGRRGQELWRTDGTKRGTRLLRDIQMDGSARPEPLGSWNGIAWYSVRDGNGGYQLWRTDGTPEGTWSVSSLDQRMQPLGAAEGGFVFVAQETDHGRSVWSVDGSLDAGATLLADEISQTLRGDLYVVSCDATTNGGAALSFNGWGSENEDGLRRRFGVWRTDGTPDGTGIATSADSFFGDADCAVVAGPAASDGAAPLSTYWSWDEGAGVEPQRYELWRTEGDGSDGTMLRAFNRIALDDWCSDASDHPRLQDPPSDHGEIVFFAADSEHGQEPWVSDGTSEGTRMLKDIRRGSRWGIDDCAFRSAIAGSTFFWANDGKHGREPWVTNGTTGGTRMLRDIRPGRERRGVGEEFVALGDVVVFAAQDGVHGVELWRTDGTRRGTRMLRDINTQPSNVRN